MPDKDIKAVATSNSTMTLLATLLMSGLFLLKGNVVNIECVGCLYDPAGAGRVGMVVPPVGKPSITKSPASASGEYNCNNISVSDFPNPPMSPTISPDMIKEPETMVPVLTKLANEQRQYIYNYKKHVNAMVNEHNKLCN